MKKLNVILLILSFILSGIGSIFLFGANASNQSVVQTHAPIVEEITEYTYKTYEDYFTDYNVSKETMTTEDYSGLGSATNPYVVYNLKGFLYLMSQTITSRYLKLDADIYLNDETFDENGNPSGGDGIVYSWGEPAGNINITVDGNGHTIHGLYVNDINKKRLSLFGYQNANRINVIKNLDVRNVYLYGLNNFSTFCYSVNKIENCNVYGTIKAEEGGCVGFTELGYNIKNCNNYINITQKLANLGGLMGSCAGGTIENCNNYGNLTCLEKGFLGGIMYRALIKNITMKNCVNFGQLYAGGNYCGGLVGVVYYYADQLTIDKCKSYGDMECNGQYCGGLIGLAEGNINILNCVVDCEIGFAKSYSGGLFGVIWNQYQHSASVKTNIRVTNCDIKIDERYMIYGSMAQKVSFGNRINLVVKNCRVELKNFLTQIVFNMVPMYCDVEYGNLSIKVLDETVNALRLFDKIEPNGTFKLRNILINLQNASVNMVTYYNSNTEKADTNGITYLCKGDSHNAYYGTDFSGFYFSWRTGEIGIVALDGRGQFQGKIDEEWLASRGFEKKQIG